MESQPGETHKKGPRRERERDVSPRLPECTRDSSDFMTRIHCEIRLRNGYSFARTQEEGGRWNAEFIVVREMLLILVLDCFVFFSNFVSLFGIWKVTAELFVNGIFSTLWYHTTNNGYIFRRI